MRKIITFILAISILCAVPALFAHAESGYETWVDYGYGVRSQVDSIYSGETAIAVGTAGDFLSTNKYLISGEYESLRFEGWCGYDQIITAIG
ncbi:MAG: hypothetical protein IKI41_07620, partial [Clostridia bacterium]|nr:hypothetical protein [Clostridia bacterium]